MKKILSLGIAAILVMALIGGGTWAYFSDTETSTNNIFTAGTLDLGLSNTSNTSATGSTTGTFAATTWKPGESQPGSLWINNEGSIAMSTVNATFSYSSVDTSGRPTTISGSPWTTNPYDYFDKMIQITAATWNGTNILGSFPGDKTLFTINGTTINLGSLPANTNAELALTFSFLNTATNGCQGNTLNMTVSVIGTQ